MCLDTYFTIKDISQGFYSDKGSKFISYAIPISTEDDVKEHLHRIKKKYFDARHHVYAFMIGHKGETFRASDDGEPSNSSGMPVLGQIRSAELTDVLIIVVRYFGGIKLGVPGLINAYKTAAKDAINNSERITKYVEKKYIVSFTYDEMNYVMKALKDFNAKIIENNFLETCKVIFTIRLSLSESLIEKLAKNHKLLIEELNE